MIQLITLGAAIVGVAAAYMQNKNAEAAAGAAGEDPAATVAASSSSLASSVSRTLPRNAVSVDDTPRLHDAALGHDIRTFLTGGRRDMTPARDESLEERLRVTPLPKPGSKPVLDAKTFRTTIQVPNVHVPNNDLDGLRAAYNSHYDQAASRQHNVTPVATSSGTAYHMVGPGLGIDRTAPHGDDGFHYGMSRIRPTNEAHQTTREQRGVVWGAQAPVKNMQQPVGDVLKNLPPRAFEVSQDYMTSATGRSIITADPKRTMPDPEWRTSRGMTSTNVPVGPAVAVADAGGNAAQMHEHTNFLLPDSGNRGGGAARVGGASSAAAGPAAGAYVRDGAATLLPTPQRGEGADTRFGVASGPGGSRVAGGSYTDTNDTQRGGADALAGGRLGMEVGGIASAVGAMPAHRDGVEGMFESRPTQRGGDAVQRLMSAAAMIASAGPSRPGAMPGDEFDRLARRREASQPTMRDLAGGPGRVGVASSAATGSAPRAGLDGYVNDSTKELEQSKFVPPAGSVIPEYDSSMVAASIELATPEVNASRGVEGKGGIGRQSTSNFYVRSHYDSLTTAQAVNKAPTYNTRLDPAVLYALQSNEWVNKTITVE